MPKFLAKKSKKLASIQKELFSSKNDVVITISIIALLCIVIFNFLEWIIHKAEWSVIYKNIPFYIFGTYPSSEIWRPAIWFILLLILSLYTISIRGSTKKNKLLLFSWISITPIGLCLILGGSLLVQVPSREWGGLMLTILLTFCSSLIAIPIGIALAIGRQNKNRVINKISSLYIDVIRSLPLISVLFFGQLLIPLFLPKSFEIDRFSRAVFSFAIFAAAYIAEDIRGGMQSIPRTQKEAAEALGLSNWQTLRLIILPQAFRTALPALTNQAIGLLQNTSLMAILGLVELLGISQSLLANPKFIGKHFEVFIWLAILYWTICTIIALLSKSLENNKMNQTINNNL